ncbi:MAG: nicotinamide riboside transporter PnuC [Saprospiraceae bacterium]
MALHNILSKFFEDIQNTSWYEWISTASQIVSVFYAQKNNVLVYPTGMIGVLLAAWMYWFIASPPLYADGVLNIYYFIMSVYGWYNWSLKNKEQVEVFTADYASKNEIFIGTTILCTSWIILYFSLKYLTNSDTPILDGLVSSSAVVAMWLMARRRIENWYAWILSNIVAIPLNYYKGFVLFTIMYVLFLGMAIVGHRSWRKMILTTK